MRYGDVAPERDPHNVHVDRRCRERLGHVARIVGQLKSAQREHSPVDGGPRRESRRWRGDGRTVEGCRRSEGRRPSSAASARRMLPMRSPEHRCNQRPWMSCMMSRHIRPAIGGNGRSMWGPHSAGTARRGQVLSVLRPKEMVYVPLNHDVWDAARESVSAHLGDSGGMGGGILRG